MIRVKLHPNQYEVATDPHRFKVMACGRRFGKSVLSRMIVLKWALEQEGVYWVVSPTYKMSKMIHWREFQKEIPAEVIRKKNEVELSIELINGSRIELKGAENPDALRGVKLRGLVVDEVASIRNFDWLWQEALRPTLTDYEAPALFIGSPKGFNHFYDLYMMGQQGGEYKSWKFSSYDNPYIPKGEIDQAKLELTEDTFMQEYMAEFRRFTGLVYKDFDREKHVKELLDFKPEFWIRGLDRGFRHPSAMPIIGVDKDDVWYQVDEIYEAGLTNPQLFNKIKDRCEGKTFELSTMDSAATSDLHDLSDMGIDFIPVKKESGETGINYVRFKIEKLTDRIRTGGYFIHPRCEKTIWEFENYKWKEKLDEEGQSENPEKIYDDMVDAIGDLNVMYLHEYKERDKIEARLAGTFVAPAIVFENDDDFTSTSSDTYWDE